MTTTLKTPKIRFKEFSGEWEEKRLGEIFDRITRKNKENNLNSLTISAQMGLVNQEDYFNKLVSSKDLTGYYLLEKGDFAYNKSYSKGYPLGAIKKLNNYDKGVVSTLYICFRTNKGNSEDFFEQYFNSQKQNHEIHKIAQEGARNHGLLNMSITDFFEEININLPSLPEQQKIASFLSSVDEKIEKIKEKKKSLEEYKKGVMQKIFSQEIRFKDENGEEFGEWEEKKLGEICEKQSSNISANSLEGNSGDYKIYGATGFLKFIDFYQEENDYISIVKDGAGVGRVLYCEGKSSVLGTLDKIKPKKGTNLYFLLSVLRNIDFTKYTIGSTIPHIYFKDYGKEKLLFPTLKEQEKIADFLSGIDEKIEKVSDELGKMEEFKKGLLQGMFV